MLHIYNELFHNFTPCAILHTYVKILWTAVNELRNSASVLTQMQCCIVGNTSE